MLAQKWQPEGQTYPWTDVTSRGWFGAHEEKYISSLKKNLESYYLIEKKGEKRKRKERQKDRQREKEKKERKKERKEERKKERKEKPKRKKENKEENSYGNYSNSYLPTPLFWQQKNFDLEEPDELIDLTTSLLLKANQS